MNEIIVLIFPIIFTLTNMCFPSPILIQFYSPSTGTIVCWDACWHEVAHKLDYEVMDKISESDEFQDAVLDFLYMEFHESPLHPMTIDIFLFPGFFVDWYIFKENTGEWAGYKWGGYSELYADILYWANGDIEKIPENLRQFYDIEEATKMYIALEDWERLEVIMDVEVGTQKLLDIDGRNK